MIFSLGNLITVCLVLIILVIYRALDRGNRSLEKVKRYSDKIRDGLAAVVEEKTHELKSLSIELGVNLKTAKQNFRSLVELSPDGIGIEQDDIVLFINSAGLKILGAESPEQIIGRQVIELVHPDYRKTVRDRISQVTTHGIISPFVEMQFVRLDGSAVDVELGSTACFYQNKSAAQAVFRDITRRKIVEQALLESEDKFRMLAETTASAIVIFQRTGIAYANPAAESLCGYTLEELKSRLCRFKWPLRSKETY